MRLFLAYFFYHSFLKFKDSSCRFYRDRAVGDDESGPTYNQVLESFAQFGLTLGIERTRSFVENENWRILHKGPRDRNALPLPPGQTTPLLTDPRIVALLLLENEGVSVRLLGSSLNLMTSPSDATGTGAKRPSFLKKLANRT